MNENLSRTSAGYIRKAAVVQTIAHITVRCDGAAGVLGVSANAAVRVSETISGEVRLAGRESVDLTVTTEDGLKKASGFAEISDRAEIEGVTPQTRAFAVCRVTDTDIVSVGGGSITLASVVETTVYVEERAVVPLAPSAEDGIYTDSSDTAFSCLTSRFSVRIESGDSEKLPITEVVCCNAGFAADAPEAALDAVYISGRFVLEGVGKTADGGITPFTVELPVSTEAAADGARRGDVAFIMTGGVYVSESRSENGVVLSAGAEVYVETYGTAQFAAVTDAFSPLCELKLTRTHVVGLKVDGAHTLTDKAEGTVTLPEGDVADKVTAVSGFTVTALSAYAENGRTVLEGAVSGYVIYSDAEAGRRGSAVAELPFRITTDVPASDGDEPRADGSVFSVTARPARKGEISVTCSLRFSVLECSRVEADPVTAMEKGEAKEEKTGVLSMHSASGSETLWDCAKALSVSPESVLAQNPDVTFPLSKGEKVFVFRSAGA